jgi:ubiquinone/menaquinone biosynthesis C-methylase UbiE
MIEEEAVVARHLSSISAARALDVGTGSGRYALLLEAMGVTSVTGADMSMAMLRHNTCGRRLCADAMSLPLPDAAFDLVNASLVAGDMPDLAGFVAELSRVLGRGGHLIYSDFHPNWDAFGWQRTFRSANGRLHALPRASHAVADHMSALATAGLDVIAADDVSLPVSRRGLGRLLPPQMLPVALVFHARKRD